MQQHLAGGRYNPRRSFSIHKRIEGGATSRPLHYPDSVESVSVSTSGSKGVQQVGLRLQTALTACFSIHKRIEGGATARLKLVKNRPYLGFSIHKRIEGGATVIANLVTGAVGEFQYPQADRRGCNPVATHLRRLGSNVSVSTSGSKGVQLRLTEQLTDESRSFSIHKRIEGGATYQPVHRLVAAISAFQYPQADRRGCNQHHQHQHQHHQHVSVSTSGSKGVQPPPAPPAPAPPARFSIHKRIEGGATGGNTARPAGIEGFSIHKRIEGGATTGSASHHSTSTRFSIHKRIEGGATVPFPLDR